MKPALYSALDLARLLHETKVRTKDQILKHLHCSAMTAWRLLKELGYLTSYNFNARYYTLVDIPHFDDQGLWSYRQIRFSRYGSLSLTVLNLVCTSRAGLSMAELRHLLQVNTTPTLLKLYQRDALDRVKVGPCYRYVSPDDAVRQSQLQHAAADQHKVLERQRLPPPEHIIAVLIELIHNRDREPQQVYRRLRAKGLAITPAEIRTIWDHYDLAKKKRL